MIRRLFLSVWTWAAISGVVAGTAVAENNWGVVTRAYAVLSGATFTGAVIVPAGTVSAPGLGISDGDDGLYEISDGQIGVAIGGVNKLTISNVALTTAGAVTAGGLLAVSFGHYGAVNAVTGADTLTSADCGRITTITAGIDGATLVLPEASTVVGCDFHLVYIGAAGGALVDISPLDSDADGIFGVCGAVTFSGTADADVGFTKATVVANDYINLTAVSASAYVVQGCQGIAANN